MLQGGFFSATPTQRNKNSWIVPYSELLLGVAMWGLGYPLAMLNICVGLSVGPRVLFNLFGGGCLVVSLAASINQICYLLLGSRLQPLSPQYKAVVLVNVCNVIVSLIYFVMWLMDLKYERTLSAQRYGVVGNPSTFTEYKLSEVHTFALSEDEEDLA